MTLFKITLELFEKYQTMEECIRCKRKILEKLKISTSIQVLVDSEKAF